MRPDNEATAKQIFTAPTDPARRAIWATLASAGPAAATDLALLAETGLVTAAPGERRRVRDRLRSAPMPVGQQFLVALAATGTARPRPDAEAQFEPART